MRGGTYFYDFCPTEGFTCCCRIISSTTIIELLPFLLKMVHGFLLLLACCRRVEAHEVASWVELEDLWTELGVDADEDHG